MLPFDPRPRAAGATPVLASGLAAALVLALAGCTSEREADLARPAATVAPEDARDAGAHQLIEEVETALTGAGPPSGVRTAEGAGDELTAAATNVRALGLREVRLRYLSPSAAALSDGEQQTYGDEAWVGDVQVSWTMPGVDERPSLLTVPVVLSGPAEEQELVSFRAKAADHLPLWLLAPLSVVRAARSVAVAPDRASARRLSVLAERAVSTVRASIPGWRDRLLVQEASTQGDFQLAAGLPVRQARAVAAVTTTPDGSADRTAAGQVFVNPRLFDPLETDGRQIVVSHEAAHVALGAATTRLPLWLSEGMADWVALRGTDLPVERLAGQVLAWVRASGGPRGLPGPSAFDGSDKRIGAWYEAAWLAVKRLGDRYGADALFTFYRQAARAGRTDAAFADALGTSERAFVRDWRAYLESLA